MMAFNCHRTLNARLLGERRINRLRLADQLRLLNVAAHADALRGGRLLFDFFPEEEAEEALPRERSR